MSSDESKLPAESADFDALAHSPDSGPANARSLIRELARLEEARIDRDNRQSDIQEKALEISDAQDRRQAEFHYHRIQLEDNADKRRTRLIGRVLLGCFLVIAIPLALFLFMVFWGNAEQRDSAMGIIRTGSIALAGYGIITALVRASASILNRPTKR